MSRPGTDGLRRFRQPQPAAEGERCELCRERIAAEHQHVVDVEARSLLCACRPCYLLFANPGAARGRYRQVPDRYLSAPGVTLDAGRWDALQIPVQVAFFLFNSAQRRVVAFYPSPAGATESELPLEVWAELTRDHPLAARLEPDVEALLVRRQADGTETFLVPIDCCYELVGRMRMHWQGFDGGPAARREIEDFFTWLRERCQPVGDQD